MSRSIWKGFYISSLFLNKKNKRVIKVWSRNSSIPSTLIGKTVLVHTGRSFHKVSITRDKVGFKFGEFALTRVYYRKKSTTKLKQKSK